MSTGDAVRHRAVERLGITGSVLGVAAGAAQVLVGARIPEWTGAKQAPVSLGLLTIALSLLCGVAAHRQNRLGSTLTSRAGCAAALLVTGALCFSTVGRLWYLPGPVLLVAGALTIDSVRDTATLVAASWLRCLLALLGFAELLMAARAAPVLAAVGAVGGIAVLAAATAARTRRSLTVLVVVGTVPFAALAWTVLVPVLLLLAAAAITPPIARRIAPAVAMGR